jgi:hypothetical protein
MKIIKRVSRMWRSFKEKRKHYYNCLSIKCSLKVTQHEFMLLLPSFIFSKHEFTHTRLISPIRTVTELVIELIPAEFFRPVLAFYQSSLVITLICSNQLILSQKFRDYRLKTKLNESILSSNLEGKSQANHARGWR